MFEKSLYDLIRGLRNHKGKEQEYIQESLRECRKEIKSQDMDLKATALLKLTYLEMFGHDMSWASFNVLEVMSSPKYLRKRVGYLGAVQSFRADTEVLMLAENLLKKDLTSATPATISLPLIAIPHVINPSMANSLLADLIPRLNHSHPTIRKKTIVTLFRLALVFPETLRPAWPKIKERLLDEDEDPSVTAAIVNVVCELGWRRPQDFLSLAPRLFELLVEGTNNWMGIKIIKLFATLTPLEPRLIKKLLPRLISIIKTTPAMSLLYECINGIIEGGVLDSVNGTSEGEELARLCVGKLRGMLMVDVDPNLKYVAILAFQKVVASHPHLVSLHQDVILECIDNPDISIRMRALDLVLGMVNSDNIVSIVDRLMDQLRMAPTPNAAEDRLNNRDAHDGVVPTADFNEEDAEESLHLVQGTKELAPLPEEYRVTVVKRVLEMCSSETYANINDFEWYIDMLVQLVRLSPSTTTSSDSVKEEGNAACQDVSNEIGRELQNVAVRVRTVRPEATRAAESLIAIDQRDQKFPSSGNGGRAVLGPSAWLVGEYADFLVDPDATLSSLLHSSALTLPERTIITYLQAIPKVFCHLAGDQSTSWTRERKTVVTLLLARIIHFLEPLIRSPSLEIQERAVQYHELMRLAAEAAEAQETQKAGASFAEPPLLLTQAIPSLFSGLELNPVAAGAQRKVPVPDDLDLEAPINPHLHNLLSVANDYSLDQVDEDDSYLFYHQKPKKQGTMPPPTAAADRLPSAEVDYSSYQQNSDLASDLKEAARLKSERMERYKDDPFYIAPDDAAIASSPLHDILRSTQTGEVDIDAIPVMNLESTEMKDSRYHGVASVAKSGEGSIASSTKRKSRKTVEILVDETVGSSDAGGTAASSSAAATAAADDVQRPELVKPTQGRAKKSLLQVDSSGLGALSLEDNGEPQGYGSSIGRSGALDAERRKAEEAEMQRALQEVERLRLEMQRAAERIQARDAPEEGTLVQKKKRRKKKIILEDDGGEKGEGEGGEVREKKKKKKKGKARSEEDQDEEGMVKDDRGGVEVGEEARQENGDAVVKLKRKKKKKREVRFDDDAGQEI